MGSKKGKRHIKFDVNDRVEEAIHPPQTMSEPRAAPSGPRHPDPRNPQQWGYHGYHGGDRGWLWGRSGGIKKQRVTEPTEPTVEAKYASLVAESDEEKRRSDTRIKDQSETIGILENDKYRLQEQNTALQAAIADLEKKLVKKSRTIDQQTKLISQQEKALAAMAMKFALGDVDTTSVVPKIEPD